MDAENLTPPIDPISLFSLSHWPNFKLYLIKIAKKKILNEIF